MHACCVKQLIFFFIYSQKQVCVRRTFHSVWLARSHSHPCVMRGPFLCLLPAGGLSRALVSHAYIWSPGQFPGAHSMEICMHPQSLLSLGSFFLSDTWPVIPVVSASLTSELSSGGGYWVSVPCMEAWKLFLNSKPGWSLTSAPYFPSPRDDWATLPWL